MATYSYYFRPLNTGWLVYDTNIHKEYGVSYNLLKKRWEGELPENAELEWREYWEKADFFPPHSLPEITADSLPFAKKFRHLSFFGVIEWDDEYYNATVEAIGQGLDGKWYATRISISDPHDIEEMEFDVFWVIPSPESLIRKIKRIKSNNGLQGTQNGPRP